jgi:trk system potassium uptake protein TrkA
MPLNVYRPTAEAPTGGDSASDYYVLGGAHVGASIARRLRASGHSVTIVDETYEAGSVPGIRGDPSDLDVLRAAGLSGVSTVVVALPRDSQCLLVAQLVRTTFDVSEVLVLVNTPEGRDLVHAAGHESICATTTLSDAVVDTLARPTHEA